MKLETPKGGHSACYTTLEPKSPLDNRNEGLCGWRAYNLNLWRSVGTHDVSRWCSKSMVILHATFFLYLQSLYIQSLALWCHAISVSFLLWGRNSWVLSRMSFKHYNPSFPLTGLLLQLIQENRKFSESLYICNICQSNYRQATVSVEYIFNENISLYLEYVVFLLSRNIYKNTYTFISKSQMK